MICNPPYVAEDSGQTSGTARADLSKRETDADLADWIDAMLYWVRERGHLSLVHRTDRLHDIISLLTPRVGGIRVCPIWPKPGRDANRVLVRGRREARAGMVLGPGITVRDPEDRVTAGNGGDTARWSGFGFLSIGRITQVILPGVLHPCLHCAL